MICDLRKPHKQSWKSVVCLCMFMLRNGHINRYSRMCMLDHEFERHSHVVNLLNDVIGFCNTSLRTELRLQKPCAKLLAQQSRSLEDLAGESSGCQGSHGILGSRQQQNQLNIGSKRSIYVDLQCKGSWYPKSEPNMTPEWPTTVTLFSHVQRPNKPEY